MTRCPRCGNKAHVLCVWGQGRDEATCGCVACRHIWRQEYPTKEALNEALEQATKEAKQWSKE